MGVYVVLLRNRQIILKNQGVMVNFTVGFKDIMYKNYTILAIQGESKSLRVQRTHRVLAMTGGRGSTTTSNNRYIADRVAHPLQYTQV